MPNISSPGSHESHELPRLFALHDHGVGWHFTLCNPHPWPGDHWGAKIPVLRDPKKLFGPMEFKRRFDWLALTGLDGVEEVRGEFIANLAYAASNVDGVFQGIVTIHPGITSDLATGLESVSVDLDYPIRPLPGFIPLDDSDVSYQERVGSRTYELKDHLYTCYPRSLLDLRSAFTVDLRTHVEVYLTADRDAAFSVGIEQDIDTWFITTDPPEIRDMCHKLCKLYSIELDESEGRIDDECSYFRSEWRARILDRRDEGLSSG